METSNSISNSNPLATESFSYSWLVDKNLPNSSSDHNPNQSFHFDVVSFAPSLVHADEIFSDGHIMPIYIDRSSLKSSNSAPQSPVPHVGKKKHFLLVKWRRVLRKYFGLGKLYHPRKSNRVDDLDRKVCEVQRWSTQTSPRRSSVRDGFGYESRKVKGSTQGSPRVSPARSSNASWCVDERSIHEAILYCKRSIES